MKRISLIYGQELVHPNHHANEVPNFTVIGNDAKNPWGIQSSKLTSAGIKDITLSGVEILASPHIGLSRPGHSMYPYMGAVISDFTGNQSYADYVAEPQNIKENGTKHNCAVQEHSILSPYLQVKSDAILDNGFVSAKHFAGHTNLAHVHHKAKKAAFGESKMTLDVDMFDVPFTFDYFKVLTENQAYILQGYHNREGIFDRFVSRTGELNYSSPGNVSHISSYLQMKQLHRDMILQDGVEFAEGYIPINEALVLFDALYCYWKQIDLSIHDLELGDTYSISGLDMINYTKSSSFRAVVDRMYKVLLKTPEFRWLPEYMVHTMIPGGGTFQFLPSNKEEELAESVLQILALDQEHGAFRKKISDAQGLERAALIEEDRVRDKKCFLRARSLYQQAYKNRRGFTQYDLLNGESVSREIVEQLMPMSFERVGFLFKTD